MLKWKFYRVDMRFKFKTYTLLLFASIILFVVGFFVSKESTIDINIHDTYFVIANCHLFWIFSILMFFFFTIYFSFDKGRIILFRALYKIHILGTLISIFFVFFPYNLIFEPTDFPLFDNMQYINVCITVSFLLFIFFQLLFIINIFVSIIKRLLRVFQ